MRHLRRPAQRYPRDRHLHAAISLLLELGADRIAHAHDRSFMQHLVGTAQLLLKWNVDLDVMLAGLCHSIYGTNAFRRITLAHDQRTRLQNVIGRNAEKLVWLFATLRRPQTLLRALRQRADWVRARNGRTLHVEHEIIQALFMIECANLLDQGLPRQTARSLLDNTRRRGLRNAALQASLRERLRRF